MMLNRHLCIINECQIDSKSLTELVINLFGAKKNFKMSRSANTSNGHNFTDMNCTEVEVCMEHLI